MKKIIKSIIFITILCIIWIHVFDVLWMQKNGISYFYEEPKNSIDVIYVGPSSATRHFNPVLTYDLYGYATYVLSCDSQPFESIQNLMIETEKYQNPKLYVIDLILILRNEHDPGSIRKVTDAMKFSKNRIETINKLLPSADQEIKKTDYINYYFSFFMYHNRWKSIEENMWNPVQTLYKGYQFASNFVKANPFSETIWNDEIMDDISEEHKQDLEELIDYIKVNNLNVLFVVPKRVIYKEENAKLNNAISIITESNLDIINFNTLEDFNVDASADFYDATHFNVYGATKYTLYFSKYLKDTYDLPDHRYDKQYLSYEQEYERFKKNFNKFTKLNFDDILLEYQNN